MHDHDGRCDDGHRAADRALLSAVGTAAARTGAPVLFDRIARLTDVYRTWNDEDVAAAIVALSTAGRAQHELLSPGIRERIDLSRYGGGGYGVLGEYGAYLCVPARTYPATRRPGTRPHLPRARTLRA